MNFSSYNFRALLELHQAQARQFPPKSKGGKARAASTSPEERTKTAKKAADARWDKSLPTVLLGAKLTLGGVEVDCYVTEDGERIIAGRGMQDILKLIDEDTPTQQKPGSRLTRLLNNSITKSFISKEKSPDHFEPKRRRLHSSAKKFYQQYGFEQMADHPLNLFTPI